MYLQLSAVALLSTLLATTTSAQAYNPPYNPTSPSGDACQRQFDACVSQPGANHAVCNTQLNYCQKNQAMPSSSAGGDTCQQQFRQCASHPGANLAVCNSQLSACQAGRGGPTSVPSGTPIGPESMSGTAGMPIGTSAPPVVGTPIGPVSGSPPSGTPIGPAPPPSGTPIGPTSVPTVVGTVPPVGGGPAVPTYPGATTPAMPGSTPYVGGAVEMKREMGVVAAAAIGAAALLA